MALMVNEFLFSNEGSEMAKGMKGLAKEVAKDMVVKSKVSDWRNSAQPGDHLWVPTSNSVDICDIGELECSV